LPDQLNLSKHSSFECGSVLVNSASGDKFMIIVVYRPPGGKLNMFVNDFHEFAKKLSNYYAKTKTNLLIAGDFNTNLIVITRQQCIIAEFVNNIYGVGLFPSTFLLLTNKSAT
jgi:hypothetical protein